MPAKIVQVSIDSGSNWLTLPGSSGSFTEDASTVDDTIFGQAYKSQEAGLINWKVEANAVYKGYAGYLATIKQGGTPTTLTAQAMAQVGSTSTWKISDAAKAILDAATTVVVEELTDTGPPEVWTDITTDVASVNYLLGEVTFTTGSEPSGSVRISGKYIPTTALGKAKSWDLKQTADPIDTTDLATAQANGGYSTYSPGLRTVTMSLKGFYDVTSGLRAALAARDAVIIEINPDGAGKSLCRGYFRLSSEGQSGDVGALEEESTSFVLNVPSSDYVPFAWDHAASSILHASVQALLGAWEDGTMVDVQYLYDGTNGVKGDAVVTDVSLSGGLTAMNTFVANFQGSGAPTDTGTG